MAKLTLEQKEIYDELIEVALHNQSDSVLFNGNEPQTLSYLADNLSKDSQAITDALNSLINVGLLYRHNQDLLIARSTPREASEDPKPAAPVAAAPVEPAPAPPTPPAPPEPEDALAREPERVPVPEVQVAPETAPEPAEVEPEKPKLVEVVPPPPPDPKRVTIPPRMTPAQVEVLAASQAARDTAAKQAALRKSSSRRSSRGSSSDFKRYMNSTHDAIRNGDRGLAVSYLLEMQKCLADKSMSKHPYRQQMHESFVALTAIVGILR